MATLAAFHAHPVKGLSPLPLDAADLVAGEAFPLDRVYAIENGPSGFDAAAAEHLPKTAFLTLMRHERLARLATRFQPEGDVLEIRQGGGLVLRASLATEPGRRAVEAFFATHLGDACRGPLRVLGPVNGHRFMDSRSGFVSLLNLASVDALSGLAERPSLDPRRFRANLHLAGLPAWE